MTKGTGGIESDDRGRGRKEQRNDKKDEEKRLSGGRVITRKTNGRMNNRKYYDMQEGERGESGSRE